jgi:type I restriction enzyme M protein
MQLPEGMKQYTKGKPIKHSEFDVVRDWWNKREENEFAHKVSIGQIQERNFNLDFKNPNGPAVDVELSSKDLKNKILSTGNAIQSLLEKI